VIGQTGQPAELFLMPQQIDQRFGPVLERGQRVRDRIGYPEARSDSGLEKFVTVRWPNLVEPVPEICDPLCSGLSNSAWNCCPRSSWEE